MTRVILAALFAVLSCAVALTQQSKPQSSREHQPPGAYGCAAVEGENGPIRCPNGSGCGSYYNIATQDCNIENEDECMVLEPYSNCCGAYPNYIAYGSCIFTEMRFPRVRSAILELASDYEILVPTCSGAYVPARIAFHDPERTR